jgi:hypothetical protein
MNGCPIRFLVGYSIPVTKTTAKFTSKNSFSRFKPHRLIRLCQLISEALRRSR